MVLRLGVWRLEEVVSVLFMTGDCKSLRSEGSLWEPAYRITPNYPHLLKFMLPSTELGLTVWPLEHGGYEGV